MSILDGEMNIEIERDVRSIFDQPDDLRKNVRIIDDGKSGNNDSSKRVKDQTTNLTRTKKSIALTSASTCVKGPNKSLTSLELD